MNSIRNIALLVSLFAATAASSCAQADIETPRIDRRQDNQQQRIDQGIASGELTNREAARLQQQQTNIERLERRAESDGAISGAERARLTHKQNQASRAIARKKHNLRRR